MSPRYKQTTTADESPSFSTVDAFREEGGEGSDRGDEEEATPTTAQITTRVLTHL